MDGEAAVHPALRWERRGLLLLAGLGAALLVVALPVNMGAQTHSGLVFFAGLAAVPLLLRLAIGAPQLVAYAALAETADLVTFLFSWQEGAGERNPLGGWLIGWSQSAFPNTGSFPFGAAGVALVLAKVALVAGLVWLAPRLGGYRAWVLELAIAVGLVGALSNVWAFVPA
jgi:hypothetical protein